MNEKGRICFALILPHFLLLDGSKCSLESAAEWLHAVIWCHPCISLISLHFPLRGTSIRYRLRREVHHKSIGILRVDLLCDFSPPFPWGFSLNTLSPGMEMAGKKGEKIKYWTFIGGRMCVLQRSSAIHFENILLIDWIAVVNVARGGLEGLLVSARLQSLQAIFNWTLILHLPGFSSFWS